MSSAKYEDELMAGSDEDTHDAYLEQMKAEGAERDEDESDSSEGGPFPCRGQNLSARNSCMQFNCYARLPAAVWEMSLQASPGRNKDWTRESSRNQA